MTIGKLGSGVPAAGETLLLFTAAESQVFNVRYCNQGAVDAAVRLAVGSGASPVQKDFLTYDLAVCARGVGEDYGLVVGVNEKVWVYSNIAGVSINAFGL